MTTWKTSESEIHINHLTSQQMGTKLSVDCLTSSGLMMVIYIDGLVQEIRNSNALAMELRLSCINPLIYAAVESVITASGNGCLMTSHYLNQCLHNVNCTCRNKLQWNLKQNVFSFFQENALANAVYKRLPILSGPKCIRWSTLSNYCRVLPFRPVEGNGSLAAFSQTIFWSNCKFNENCHHFSLNKTDLIPTALVYAKFCCDQTEMREIIDT